MSDGLGSLVVSLSLEYAKFNEGISQIAAATEKGTSTIVGHLSTIQSTFLSVANALGVGFSVHQLTSWAEHVVLAAEELRNLSLETGSSVEDLSRLSNQAAVSGVSFEKFHTLIDRLAAGMAGSEDKSTRTGKALQAMGIAAKDPADALQQVADKFETYADGANKLALAKDLFGKGSAQMIGALHEIATGQDIVATRTTQDVAEAAKLAESFRTLQIEAQYFAQLLLREVVPGLADYGTALIIASRQKGGLFAGLAEVSKINVSGDIPKQMADIQNEIAANNETIAAGPKFVLGLPFLGVRTGTDPEILAAHNKTLGDRLSLLQQIDQQQQRRNTVGPPESLRDRPDAPRVKKDPAGGLEDTSRKILEGQIRAQDALIEEEKQALKFRDDFLTSEYQAGNISLENYYAGRRQATQEGIDFDRQAYQQEIADLTKYIADSSHKDADRESARNKLIDVTKKLQLAEGEAASQTVKGLSEERKAAEEYRHALDGITAKYLELRGDSGGATALRLRDQNEDLRRRLTASGDFGALAQLDDNDRRAIGAAQLSDEQQRYSTILDGLAIKQSRIDLLTSSGAITEIDALNRKADLARAYVGVLQTELDKQQQLVASGALGKAGDPAFDRAITQIERYKLEIDTLAVSVDALGKKFNDVFANDLTSALDEITSGTKKASDVAKDLIKSIAKDIGHIANQNISQTLFAKDGPLGGIGGFFSQLFGGKKKGDVLSSVGDIPGVSQLNTSSLTTSFSTLASAAYSAAGALHSIGGGGLGSGLGGGLGGFSFPGADLGSSFNTPFGFDSIGGPFDFLGIGAFADGGDIPGNRPSFVGEKGTELFVPKTSGTIIPHDVLTARRNAKAGDVHNYNINVNVPGNTSRASASQIAQATAAEVSRAMRRR